MPTLNRSLVALLALFIATQATPALAQYEVQASSFLGGAMADEIRGTRIQSDGTIVLAANTSALPSGVTPTLLPGALPTSTGALLRLSPEGDRVLSVTRFAGEARDLALDAEDNVWLAAGSAGVIALNPDGSFRWSASPGHVHRIDVASDGRAAALVPTNVGGADDTPGEGQVVLFDAAGAELRRFAGHRNTLDIAFDATSETVVLIGWRQATANDGMRNEPVQIAYLRGVGTDGMTRWTDYDWSTDVSSPSFINRPENNMADTRGYRVSFGRDGRLLAAFECAGGNHIFRYLPTDISTRSAIVLGDNFHTFSNTRSEHKTFFGIYDPRSGEYLTGQQLVGRLSSGRGNTVRVQRGEITTDESGRVYLVGAAASGLPLTLQPEGTGDYTGGAYLAVMSADLTTRLFITRLTPSGRSQSVDARTLGANTSLVFGGEAHANDMGDPQFFARNALQPTLGGGEDGFFGVLTTGALEPLSDAGPRPDGGPRADAGIGSADAGPSVSQPGCGCRATRHAPSASTLFVALASLCLLQRRRASSRKM
jgi:hypothetical protein